MESKNILCGGSEICEHNRFTYTCKECKGICSHARQTFFVKIVKVHKYVVMESTSVIVEIVTQ